MNYPTYQPQYPYNYISPQPQQMATGFISVQSEDEARRWGIAPGNSMTFKDENAPFVYTKTMGFSQLDRPIFEKYRLVKMEDIRPEQAPAPGQSSAPTPQNNSVETDEITEIKRQIEELRKEIQEVKNHE